VLDFKPSQIASKTNRPHAGLQTQALQRVALRDADDWPVLACAMTIGCPVWTEDADFFRTGVATWTTDQVELYLVPGKPPFKPVLVGVALTIIGLVLSLASGAM
jgi:hypothetical protein